MAWCAIVRSAARFLDPDPLACQKDGEPISASHWVRGYGSYGNRRGTARELATI